MKLLIVIVSYKVTDLTIDCLKSLAPEIHRVPDTQVAVCENGTGPEDARRIQQAIDANGWGNWCKLTAIPVNLGFTGGNNVILREAMASDNKPEYVILLNSDTIVLERGMEALVRFMDQNPKIGIGGSRLEMPDGTVHISAFRYHSLANEFDRGMKLGIVSKLMSKWGLTYPPPATACEADWVAGASMIIRRPVLEQIGLLDEDYYTYFDDIDYCMRARRAGWPTYYVPESRVIHLVGCSTKISDPSKEQVIKPRPRYWYQARTRFFVKSYGCVYAALVDMAFLTGFAFWKVRRWLQGKPDPDPKDMFKDTLMNSVFVQGCKLKPVENPALKSKAA